MASTGQKKAVNAITVSIVVEVPRSRRLNVEEDHHVRAYQPVLALIPGELYEFGLLMPNCEGSPKCLLQIVRGKFVEREIEDECELISLVEGDDPYDRLLKKLSAMPAERIFRLPRHQRKVIEGFLNPGFV